MKSVDMNFVVDYCNAFDTLACTHVHMCLKPNVDQGDDILIFNIEHRCHVISWIDILTTANCVLTFKAEHYKNNGCS